MASSCYTIQSSAGNTQNSLCCKCPRAPNRFWAWCPKYQGRRKGVPRYIYIFFLLSCGWWGGFSVAVDRVGLSWPSQWWRQEWRGKDWTFDPLTGLFLTASHFHVISFCVHFPCNWWGVWVVYSISHTGIYCQVCSPGRGERRGEPISPLQYAVSLKIRMSILFLVVIFPSLTWKSDAEPGQT